MFKKTVIIGASILSLALASTVLAEGNGPESMELKGGSLGDVHFPHKQHQDSLKDCDACHKLFPQEAGSVQKLIADGKLKKKDVMKNCVDCHKENKSKGTATGPTSCKDCHKK